MTDIAIETPPRRRLQRIAIAIVVLLAALCLLLVSGAPAVAPTGPPTTRTVEAARDAVRQIRDRSTPITRVRMTNRELHGVASLASDATGIERVDARIADGSFSAAASVPLPIWGWINGAVVISGQHRGFPELKLHAGHVTLPAWAGRRLAELGRLVLRWRGAQLPPLDQLVRRIAIGREELVADISLPSRSGLVSSYIGVKGRQVDNAAVAAIYCRLAALQREQPDFTLATQVRRAFATPPGAQAEAPNRDTFVALAMYVVEGQALDLARPVVALVRKCSKPAGDILLAGRADLAKHWTFSAALASVLGTDTAGAMGEWKELDDSRPSGSGFSFVDLAADRSGVHAGRLGADPATSAETARSLARTTEPQLFPITLLAAKEGMSEQQFLARYGTIRTQNYQAAIRSIDRVLGYHLDRL